MLKALKSLYSKPEPKQTIPVETYEQKRERFEKLEASFFPKGKKIIYQSNEWDNPIVGVMVKVDFNNGRGMFSIVYDYVTKQELCFIGLPMHYTEQRLNALLKLDPFERCSLLYKTNYNDEAFDKDKGDEIILTPEELIAKLHANGFYDLPEPQNETSAD